ncbi:MAG: carbohydrate kinase family protein [Clostridia bacterium]|nr:carbohydrate kinase family protein [Clostridia bacterium]
MKKRVIVAGHICLDITPVFQRVNADGIEKLLVPGRLIEMQEADVHTGGAVANTGLGMKLLGAEVTLMGKIGNDAFGKMILDILKEHQAQEGMLVAEGESTSYSVVLAIPGVDRIFLHNPGANNTFVSKDIPEKAMEDAALFHFGYPPLMKKMYDNEGEELVKILQKAKASGAATSMDMAAVDEKSEAGRVPWKKILEKCLPYLDFFVPSVEELCYMLDPQRLAEWKERAGNRDITEILDVDKDVKPLADQCMAMGTKILLIKCGAPGLYYRSAGRDVLKNISGRLELDVSKWMNREGFERSYVPDAVLSGMGAGDTSIAAFLTAMLDGYSMEECLRLATATGACCVSAYDALSGLKSFAQLQERIKNGWQKQ